MVFGNYIELFIIMGPEFFNISMSCLVFLKNGRTQIFLGGTVHDDVWLPLENFTLPILLLNYGWKKVFLAAGLYQMPDFRMLWRFCSLSTEHKVSQGWMNPWAWLSQSLICKVDLWLKTPLFLPKSVLLTSSEHSEKKVLSQRQPLVESS